MSKTEYNRIRHNNIFLHTTQVENLFINELLPIAPGDYVKVYLFCLMYAENEQPVEPNVLANVLGMSADEIDRAWAYWEDKGVVRRDYDRTSGQYRITFLSQIEALFDGETAEPEEPAVLPEAEDAEEEGALDMAALQELELRGLFTAFEETTGRTISRRESDKIRDAVGVYGVTPDVFAYAIKYCAEIEKYSVDYIFKVALRWKEEGCQDISQVREFLDRGKQRNLAFNSIFREMGFTRMPSPADRELMSSWMDELGFSLAEILDACRLTAGQREPNLKYVNSVLRNRRLEAGGVDPKAAQRPASGTGVSKRILGEYYSWLRNRAEEEQQKHLEEARQKVPGLGDLLALEAELNRAIVSFDFGRRSREDRKVQVERRQELEAQKRRLLRENGYPEDYLEKHYRCAICKDTGVTDEGIYCSCVEARTQEAYTWNSKRTKDR